MVRRIGIIFASVFAVLVAVFFGNGSSAPNAKPAIPEMKFNDVKEIAPGVFFRYSSISATDPKVPFGGSNNIWIVFKDFVVVVDANFPKEADDVIADIKKTTDKPIKYVLDTHHHGDHAYGNCIWSKIGAKIVAHKNAARLMMTNGPKQWEDAAKGREDIKKNELKQADISFDDIYVIEDATQRVEFRYFGHSHTIGDASCYIPKYKILCTGDACVNGSFNFMGHSSSAGWIKCLEKMKALDVEMICPGHGKVATRELLDKQSRYFAEMRTEVKKGIDAKKSLDDIVNGIDMAWYKEWTGKAAKDNKDNLKHVYEEFMGKIDHERLGSIASPLGYTTTGEPTRVTEQPKPASPRTALE